MSSNHFQELQFPDFSESIKNLDDKYMESAIDMICQKKENFLEYMSGIDYRQSLAWDSAFFTSPGILDPEELFERLNFRDVEHGVDVLGIVSSESQELERTNSICEFNSRKSLAWDSAFFTSAGVLDPEELSLVNKGFKKSATHVLPENGEKTWKSVESNSLINSDDSSLASLEVGLFDDSKASNFIDSSSKLERGNGFENTHSLKKLDASSRVKKKSLLALKRQNLNKYDSERSIKATSLPPKIQHVGRAGYCSPLSSLKPPKVSGRVNSPMTSLSKRANLDPNHIKTKNKATKAASGESMTLSKRPCLGNSSPKSPSLFSHTPKNKSAKLGSLVSDSGGRFPQNSLRRKINSRLAASVSPSSSRNLQRNEVELLNSSLPSHLFSSLEPLVTSPASSIEFDIWSSESSASINRRSSNSTGSLDTTCKRISHDADGSQASESESHICDQNRLTQDDQDKWFPNQNAKTISTANSSVLTNISKNIRPSGLRMPSPKLGFFDAENSITLTPQNGMKFHYGARCSSSKIGRAIANHNRDATRIVHSKLQSARTLSKIRNTKLDSQQTGDPTHRFSIRLEGQENRITKKQSSREHNHSRKQSLLPILNDDDKENSYSFHNQMDNLSKHIEAINFKQDL